MTNLEWLKRLTKCKSANQLKFYENDMLCEIAYKLKYQDKCIIGLRDCRKCELNTLKNSLDFLLQEHKEPIKLKQWEYDVIKYHGKLSKFNDIHFLMAMKNKGHFKDMNSVEKCSMTIKEILENCEIVTDDYFKE